MHNFESGYNGDPWSLRKLPEDVFYCELDSCAESEGFNKELVRALKEKDYTLIDDGSLVSQALKGFFPQERTIRSDDLDPDPNFQQEIKNKFEISNGVDLQLLSSCYKLNQPVCLPFSSGRIFNLNFRRTSQAEIGQPYFVFSEPERFHKLRMVAKTYKLPIIVDILKITPEVFRSYILHDLHMEIFKAESFPYPHNDLVERKIWASLNSRITDLYPKIKSAPLEMGSYSHFPLHGLLRKYFYTNLKINLKEQELYGSAY